MSEREPGGSRFGVLGVFTNYALAKLVPGNAVVRLVSSLGSPDEDTSMAAYVALVKLGDREPVTRILLEQAAAGHQTAAVLQVLGDVEDPSLIGKLEPYAASEDVKVAAAARESIAALRECAEEQT